jgi:hypothetical protein
LQGHNGLPNQSRGREIRRCLGWAAKQRAVRDGASRTARCITRPRDARPGPVYWLRELKLMGIVSNALRSLVSRQVEENGLIVWYDPEKHYEAFADRLKLPGTRVVRYEGGFFAVRHAVEPLLAGSEKPRLVVYVPLDQLRTGHALVDLEQLGVVMQPGQQPPSRNTKLSLLARNALKAVLGPETAAVVERQAENPGLSLSELDRLGERGAQLKEAVLPLIFHTDNPTEIALAFRHDDRHDVQVAMDSGARRALLPVENKRQFLEVPGDIVEKVDPVFYSDPLTAAVKALGLT